MDLINSFWPWYITGPMIALTMYLMLLVGRRFGISSTYEHLCKIAGADKLSDYFKFNMKEKSWQLVFVSGSIIGAYIAVHFMMPSGEAVHISEATQENLRSQGFANPGSTILPAEIFSWEAIKSGLGLLFMVVGGFLVGFGSRYAGGCTSGHAISGLSNLQLPSLIAVIGFFAGGLAVTWLVLPYVFTFIN